MTIFTAIKRYLIILVAYALAALVAGYGVAAMGLVIEQDAHPFLPFPAFGGFASLVIALFASIPASLFVLLAEWRSWRAIWLYCGFAMLTGLCIGVMMMRTEPGWFPYSGLAVGIASGAVFWFIAGRRAGVLKQSDLPFAQPQLLGLLGFSAALMAVLMLLYAR